jgi:phenylacetate-CoA ligase
MENKDMIDYMPREELIDLQNKKLREIIPYIAKVPFYKKKLSEGGISIEDIKEISDLQKIPFTTKEELRLSEPMERTSLNYDGIAFFFSSSGTTGDATIYPWSPQDDLVLREASARCMKRIGVGPGDISLVLAPFGMSIMWYCMINQYLATGAGVVPLGIPPPNEIIKSINAFPITFITTLPIIGTRLFEFMEKNKIPFVKNRLRQFHFGGDYLSNARRSRIEKYWDLECFDFYGISEIFGPIAGECSERRGLHCACDYILVEVINPETKKSVSEEEVGVAVYTTLWEKGAPLLRYWSGDFITLTWEKCKCGRTSPRIIYKGRLDAGNGIKMNDKIIFAKDLEDILLSFPEVSDEWAMKIEGTLENPIAKIFIERVPGQRIPDERIREEITNLVNIPVGIEVVPPGFFPRDDVKPKRIVDSRIMTQK